MAGNLITSLLSLATNLLPSITASAQAPSSSSSNPNCNSAVVEDLESIMRTLERIKATLYDAEEREIRDRSVKLYLKELKKVAYDAEDVLSEYKYEVTRVQVEAKKASEASGSHKREQIEYIVPISNGTIDRLNKIRNRFDEIANDREALQLRESDGVRRPNNKNLQPPTGHMVDETSIFGRKREITKVIDFLLSEKEKLFLVISIIGKGGLGKTTIAQLVYKSVSQCFDLNGWVCVSNEFDVKRLTNATIESFSKTNYGMSELSPLQEELAKTVKGKTILLVLDDVWNENKSLWELFRIPFKEAKMVRILVTTRNENVAYIMQTTSYFSPTYLSEDSSWQLFQHYAFSGTSDTMPLHLVDMGRKITRKCGGLPLAVKSIASLLGFEEANEEFWREILESDLWEIKESKNVIFPALQISYAHLPAHLKLCFLICSMYPKDYKLRNMELINLWIAHGYVESQSNRNIIEIGVDYYHELKKRSFLDDAYFGPPLEYCKLHDIIHDLARLISENEHYSVEINQPLDIQKRTVLRKVYHLFVSSFMEFDLQIPQQKMMGLRTIFMDIQKSHRVVEVKYCTNCTRPINPNLELTKVCQDCLEDIAFRNLTKFEVLRVLILKWDSLTRVPHSISELKHLTYLSISSEHLTMLPLSIGLLYNLLALEVECASLEYLPENIGDLTNLQFLRIRSQSHLQKLPKSLCSLTNLLELALRSNKFLDYVPHGLVNFPSITEVLAWWNVRTIGWLKDMKNLKGKISIGRLRNINNLEDAKRANLSNKCKLVQLDLCWDDHFLMNINDLYLDLIPEACGEGIVGADDVHLSLLECLQPHPNLKTLGVKGYPSAIVPGWMRDPFLLKSIQELLIENCGYIESLPFGNLHTLKSFSISTCSSIKTMWLEQLPSQLEVLQISDCEYLELITGLGHLNMLRTLIIEWCTLLHFLPDGFNPSGPCYVNVFRCGCPDFIKWE